jgi:predicted enzyme related to lactoylglutathione lyase
MDANPPTGRVVWHDLMTPDPKRACAFYAELFGWSIAETDMPAPDGRYWMISAGDAPIGGLVPFTRAPAHWIAYVTVDDVDAAVARARRAGGQVPMPGMTIPAGRFAVIQDPSGACIQPWKGAHPEGPEPEGPPPVGHFCWDQLLTDDLRTCVRFYGEVFGWRAKQVGAGGQTYTVFCRGEKETAGVLALPPGAEAHPHWLPYVAVDDVDAATARIGRLGGRTHCPPTDIEGLGRFSVSADPQGAVFAVYRALGRARA